MLKRDFEIKRTRKNFSNVAWFYDFWGKITESKAINEAVSISDMGDNIVVLDVGVGTGQLFRRILSENNHGLNFGVDLSAGMLAKAKTKFKSSKANYLLSFGNAFELPYKSESIDYLFSSYVLDLLPEENFNTILNEFSRLLKTHGKGIVITMAMGKYWYNRLWYLAAKYFPALLTNCRPIEISDYLISAGFNIVEKVNISQNTFPSEIIKFQK
jgi:ubiquinone/menaquinone biosynthesis C-methylase UbiE